MSDFFKPLSSRSPKWWLIVAILVIDGLVAQISATTCTSVASLIAIVALLLLLSLFVYCLYFKIFFNGKEEEKVSLSTPLPCKMSRVWRTSAIQYRKKILSARHVLLYNLPSLWSANSSCKRASQDIYMFLFGRHVYHDSNVFVLVLRSMGFHSSLTFRSSICYSDGYYRCYFNYTKYKIFKLIKRKLMPLL